MPLDLTPFSPLPTVLSAYPPNKSFWISMLCLPTCLLEPDLPPPILSKHNGLECSIPLSMIPYPSFLSPS